jgi:2-hydroxychromene-2-carboxylate isomerase
MITKLLMPYMAKILSSDSLLNTKRVTFEFKRRISHQPHKLEVFVAISDPYSYLLLQVLPELTTRFNLEISVFTIRDKQEDMFPDLSKWQTNSLQDASYLAQLYELEFPLFSAFQESSDKIIDSHTAKLLSVEGQPDVLIKMRAVFDNYWLNQENQAQHICYLDQALTVKLEGNQQYLHLQGHYFSAMIKFAGEWYWGLDRLDHLEKRLNKLGVSSLPEQICYDRQTRDFCVSPPQYKIVKHDLVMYFSARSPYSYLGLERAVKLCAHYQCRLVIKPVLPMMMRGMNVPHNKKMYIFHDTKREASKLNIPYGFVADPLGKAVENCYALFDFARSEGKEINYLLAFGRAVNSRGIRADNDLGMRLIIEGCGLDWNEAKKHLNKQDWHQWTERNMRELSSLGLWGVPCFHYGDVVTWGQDRLWLIENEMNRGF